MGLVGSMTIKSTAGLCGKENDTPNSKTSCFYYLFLDCFVYFVENFDFSVFKGSRIQMKTSPPPRRASAKLGNLYKKNFDNKTM